MTDKEAIRYAIKLKDFCRRRKTCRGCPLVVEGRCALDWEIAIDASYKDEDDRDLRERIKP